MKINVFKFLRATRDELLFCYTSRYIIVGVLRKISVLKLLMKCSERKLIRYKTQVSLNMRKELMANAPKKFEHPEVLPGMSERERGLAISL